MVKIKNKYVYVLVFLIIFSSLFAKKNKIDESREDKSIIKSLKLYTLSKGEGYGTINYILNHKNPRKMTMYFKGYDDYTQTLTFDEVKGVKYELQVKFFEPNNLHDYLSTRYIELDTKEKFLYGKIEYRTASPLKLELYYITKDNEEIKKVYYKEREVSTVKILNNELEKINSDERNGFFLGSFTYGEVIFITENKLIKKGVRHLEESEKIIYDHLIDLFKEELPKEFFKNYDKR